MDATSLYPISRILKIASAHALDWLPSIQEAKTVSVTRRFTPLI